ncbi:MAG TPA: ribokinase [Verrucomicrobiae bacterium]|nr:ribokinase [Verrucomicrobiae bacterium]
MKKPKICVVGSSNTDMMVKVPRIPQPGETILGGEFITAAGGKGANQAVAAARAGGNVTFIARVGNDIFGTQAIASLVANRINTKFVFRDKNHPSGAALIFVANDGQNSIAVASGANGHLSPMNVKQAEPAIIRADILVAQLETPLPTVIAAVQLAAKHRVPIILNPAPANSLPANLLHCISVLTPNESEAELLTGVKITSNVSAMRAAKKLRARGVKKVVITLGANGAFISDEIGERHCPGFKVKALDTTAAGDVFNGALAVALAEGKTLDSGVRFACAAAALSVTRPGAQTSVPTRANIEAVLSAGRQS